jgi:hypothetical protein
LQTGPGATAASEGSDLYVRGGDPSESPVFLDGARLILLGIKKEIRTKKRYGGLSTALYVEMATRGARVGYEWGELGWTVEDNRPVNLAIKMMGGEVYKRYRIYEKSLA